MDRDIVRRAVFAGNDPQSIPLADVASNIVQAVQANADIDEAFRLIQQQQGVSPGLNLVRLRCWMLSQSSNYSPGEASGSLQLPPKPSFAPGITASFAIEPA